VRGKPWFEGFGGGGLSLAIYVGESGKTAGEDEKVSER